MNNTSRSSTYGIIAILLLLVVGVVWFYSSKNASDNRNIAQKAATSKQSGHTPEQSAASPTFLIATGKVDADGRAVELARGLQLNDDEIAQIMTVIDSTRDYVNEIMADQATVIEADDYVIKLKTGLSDDQAVVVERRMFDAMFQIVGAERWELFNDDLDTTVRHSVDNFGRGDRTYTIMGGGRDDPGPAGVAPNSNKNYLPLFGAERIYIYTKIDYDGRTEMGGGSVPLFIAAGSSAFKRFSGKMATMILALIEGQPPRHNEAPRAKSTGYLK